MSLNKRMNLLGIYDLILAMGAIYIGIEMIGSKEGVFMEYPKEWISKAPFESWVVPGIIAIVVFGLGNIIAAICSFRKAKIGSWFISTIMGLIFFISLFIQVIVLGEWYLATIEFLVLSIIQIFLCVYVFYSYRRN